MLYKKSSSQIFTFKTKKKQTKKQRETTMYKFHFTVSIVTAHLLGAVIRTGHRGKGGLGREGGSGAKRAD